MGTLKTVLFDFDGTLMDTNQVILQSWQHTFRTLEGTERDEAELLKTFGEPLALTMERMFPQVGVEDAISIYRSYQHEHFLDLINVFPGVISTLEALKAAGIQLGLVTSRLRYTTELGLEKYDLIKYFDTIVTCEDTEEHKPSPEPVFAALEKLQAKVKETIMVGDTMFDILCGKNAGVKTALVGWALAVDEDEKIGANAPDYLIERPEELLEIVK